jgi:hypothetical protein
LRTTGLSQTTSPLPHRNRGRNIAPTARHLHRHLTNALNNRADLSGRTSSQARCLSTRPTQPLDTDRSLKCAFYAMIDHLALQLTIFLEPPVS